MTVSLMNVMTTNCRCLSFDSPSSFDVSLTLAGFYISTACPEWPPGLKARERAVYNQSVINPMTSNLLCMHTLMNFSFVITLANSHHLLYPTQ